LPLLSAVASTIFSPTFRSTAGQPHVIAILLVGMILNVAGYVWMNRLTLKVRSTLQPTTLHQLVSATTVSLHAGESLITAIENWNGINSVGTDIAHRLLRGEPLAAALLPLEKDCGDPGRIVRRLIIDNHRTGTPVTELIVRLQEDVESDIYHQSNIGIQQMATKLTFPIVLCVLPAFLLLALLPIVISSLNSLPSTSVT
jgi:hypothetical protein